jgi:hypothetical protein
MVLKACELLNIVLSALVTGVFWGPWVGLTRSIATFEPAAFLAIGYRLNVNLAPLMTVLMPVALLTAVPTLVLSVGGHPATFVLTLIGVLLFVVALVVTLAIEVPIAVRIKSWASGTALPDDWRQQRDRWAAVHVVRVATGIAGLGLLVAGAVFG